MQESYDDSEAERVKNKQLLNQFFDGIHTRSMELVVPRCFSNVLHCYKSYNTLKLHLTDGSKELEECIKVAHTCCAELKSLAERVALAGFTPAFLQDWPLLEKIIVTHHEEGQERFLKLRSFVATCLQHIGDVIAVVEAKVAAKIDIQDLCGNGGLVVESC